MNRLRWSLLLGYVMATLMAHHAHEHRAAQADLTSTGCPAEGDAPHDDAPSHLHEGHTAQDPAHTDHCLACKFRSDHQVAMTSPVIRRPDPIPTGLHPAASRLASASIARPTGRAPPLA